MTIRIDIQAGAASSPQGVYGFALADDHLPPRTLRGLSDAELLLRNELWPFPVWRDHRKKANLPATVTTLKKGKFTHSVDWLLYWADNCALAWYDVWNHGALKDADRNEFIRLWQWLTRGNEVITNGKGVQEGYYDPVTGENLGNEPIGIDALHMERNVFLPASTELSRYGGVEGYEFLTFDGSEEPPNIRDVNYRNAPGYFTKANILMAAVQKGPDGTKFDYKPNGFLGLHPFPQGWDRGAHTPLPVICMPTNHLPGGVNHIPLNRIHLTDGKITLLRSVPNPYNHDPEINLR